jgi:hypothetical protein
MPTATTLSLGQASSALGPDSTQFGTSVAELKIGGAGQNVVISNKTTGSPIENLTLDTALSPSVSSSNVSFGSAVSGLDANLGDGTDTITFTSSVSGSTIFTDSTSNSAGGGGDRFTANGGISDSSVSTGAGNDTLLFAKEVIDSTIQTGTGNDNVTVQANSFASNSSFELGGGNDTLTFQGTVFGYGDKSFIDLGKGSDTLIFGANSYVAGYSIDLGGADGATDNVRFESGLAGFSDVQITGASTGDVLFIGGTGPSTGSYSFNGSVFVKGSDTLTLFS